jgi:lipid-binding SYLF domain-containing protein
MKRRKFVTRFAEPGLLVATVLAASCSTAGTVGTTDSAARDARKQEIDASVDGAMDRLFSSTSGSPDPAHRAQGTLVFPRVISAGVGIGGEYGEGSLRSRGADGGYYKMKEASVGTSARSQTSGQNWSERRRSPAAGW